MPRHGSASTGEAGRKSHHSDMGSKQLGNMQAGFFIEPVGGSKLDHCVLGPSGTVELSDDKPVPSASVVFDAQGKINVIPDTTERRTKFYKKEKLDGFDGKVVGVWKLEL